MVVSAVCIDFYGRSGTIARSNIILNNSPSYYGVIFVEKSDNYNLIQCIFDQNQNTLLYVSSGTLELNNCYYLTGSSSTVGIVSNTLLSTRINFFTYDSYNTYYCSPSIDTQFKETPSPTISNTLYPSISESTNSKSSIYLQIFPYFLSFILIFVLIYFY